LEVTPDQNETQGCTGPTRNTTSMRLVEGRNLRTDKTYPGALRSIELASVGLLWAGCPLLMPCLLTLALQQVTAAIDRALLPTRPLSACG